MGGGFGEQGVTDPLLFGLKHTSLLASHLKYGLKAAEG